MGYSKYETQVWVKQLRHYLNYNHISIFTLDSLPPINGEDIMNCFWFEVCRYAKPENVMCIDHNNSSNCKYFIQRNLTWEVIKHGI